uniref:Methyltransferase type 11 domain-containing protein n=1 Tax=Candidatus Methanophaga sp. ANME-1 ERB7 TaxID=2759913 RepID=A0A7G9Z6A6_9EURY|nr:hypothetical protein LEBEIBBM_00005 [Methanosarcinales archaeon ANME-1 ERB7]
MKSDIDLAFIFGPQYIAGGLENVISEMHRILKPGGVFSFEKSRGSEKKLTEDVERGGFVYARLLVKLLRINPKNLRRHCDRDELKFHRIPPPDEC